MLHWSNFYPRKGDPVEHPTEGGPSRVLYPYLSAPVEDGRNQRCTNMGEVGPGWRRSWKAPNYGSDRPSSTSPVLCLNVHPFWDSKYTPIMDFRNSVHGEDLLESLRGEVETVSGDTVQNSKSLQILNRISVCRPPVLPVLTSTRARTERRRKKDQG